MWNLLNRIDGELLRLEQRAEGMEEERNGHGAATIEQARVDGGIARCEARPVQSPWAAPGLTCP